MLRLKPCKYCKIVNKIAFVSSNPVVSYISPLTLS